MEARAEKIFTRGVNCFTQADLFEKAASLKGLEFSESLLASSKNIKEYALTFDLLLKLGGRGIKRNYQPQRAEFEFILEDENIVPKPLVDYPTNRWEFRRGIGQEFDLRIFLFVGFERWEVNNEVKGILLRPQAYGTFSQPSDQLAHFHLFKALVESDPSAPEIAKELAASNGKIILTWLHLGLEGLCFRPDFFRRFVNGNKEVFELSKKKIFVPAPFSWRPEEPKEKESLYDAKAVQGCLVRRWSKQLRKYRESLVIKRRKKAIV